MTPATGRPDVDGPAAALVRRTAAAGLAAKAAEHLVTGAGPAVARFSLSDAQVRLLLAAAAVRPSPCLQRQEKYRRTLEVLKSLQLVTGDLGGFSITSAGLAEIAGRGLPTNPAPGGTVR